ncbi:hypothetical protein DSL72_001429 [Monilinia vaccinii-corymbosi]|uniref:CWH43-like N-terminal domain-containing protein n=1 Tax=Monilinia vaccinii-corymbosi TaxID=61207 RepID=A0A8A3P4U7_9HELO|nr:hypothetical protein DSL72_001429 [Monilinia vaccinii-corymbosi]
MFRLSYWMIPVFSGIVWLAMLLAMLLTWVVADGAPVLVPMDGGQTIAYISDIGAHELQPLFIAMGTLTVVTFNMVFISERWLRHNGRLHGHTSIFQRVLSSLAILCSMAGGIGLICLTCLNDVKHHRAHDICLAVFIGGYILSAIFICWEYQRLGIHYRQHRVLRTSFWVKLSFIIVELGLAIGFGICNREAWRNTAAVLEWIIALVYTFYVWSFAIDFLPAIRTKRFESGDGDADLEGGMAIAMEGWSGRRQRGVEGEQSVGMDGNAS